MAVIVVVLVVVTVGVILAVAEIVMMAMAVVVAVGMGMAMAVLVAVFVAVGLLGSGDRHLPILLTGAGAFALTQAAAIGEAFHMVVMAVLGRSDLSLKPKHLGTVFAERAVHVRVTTEHIEHPFSEGGEHEGVIAQIGGGQEFHLGMIHGHSLGVREDPADKNTRKQ